MYHLITWSESISLVLIDSYFFGEPLETGRKFFTVKEHRYVKMLHDYIVLHHHEKLLLNITFMQDGTPLHIARQCLRILFRQKRIISRFWFYPKLPTIFWLVFCSLQRIFHLSRLSLKIQDAWRSLLSILTYWTNYKYLPTRFTYITLACDFKPMEHLYLFYNSSTKKCLLYDLYIFHAFY